MAPVQNGSAFLGECANRVEIMQVANIKVMGHMADPTMVADGASVGNWKDTRSVGKEASCAPIQRLVRHDRISRRCIHGKTYHFLAYSDLTKVLM